MTVQQDVLDQLNLAEGCAPMTWGQFERRIQAFADLHWPTGRREIYPDEYRLWVEDMDDTRVAALAAWEFNHQLAAYRSALTRLAKYRLADGRDELTEDVETGDLDPETGEATTETIVTLTEVEPLPATVDQIDPETGETETVPNPLIVADDAERAAAQAVIDGTPQPVKDFG